VQPGGTGADPLLLRSKVARRLLGMFLACALWPIIVLAASAFVSVSNGLREQSEERVHQASKAAALLVLDRLQELAGVLSQLAALPDPRAEWPRFRGVHDELHTLASAITVVGADGTRTALVGPLLDAVPAPPLTGAEVGHLALERRRGAVELLLAVPAASRRHGPGGSIVAAVRVPELLSRAVANALPPQAEYCVLAGEVVLGCSSDAFGAAAPAVAGSAGRRHVGALEAEAGGERWFVGHWSLFLHGAFGADDWTVMVAEPRSAALAVLARFRSGFPAAAIACFGLVFLASAWQIRRHMDPLGRLREATRRVGEGRFDVEVEVATDDEFRDLAQSFNGMTRRLAEHFELLERLIALDREILSSTDERSVVSALLGRLEGLHPCDAVAVLLVEPARGDRFSGWLRALRGEGRWVPLAVDRGEIDEVPLEGGTRGVVELPLGNDPPRLLAPLAALGVRRVRVLTLRDSEGLLGLLLLGIADAGALAPDPAFARQVADQAAIAISNARTAEHNRFLAQRDALTGLANRVVFMDRLEQALSRAHRDGSLVAVLLVDLDRFKAVNDTLGHAAGDRLLRLLGARLEGVLREGTLARLGGDEFAVLLLAPASAESTTAVAQRIQEALTRPFSLDGREIFVTGSIGIAAYPMDGSDAGSLLQHADAAMYQAKAAGGGRFSFYTREIGERALHRLALEAALRRALEHDEIRIEYQPVVDLRTRTWVGFEALARWTSPELGSVSPGEFIGIAEETGLIVPLGEQILRTACRQAREWELRHGRALRVAVNVARRQLRDRSLIDAVDRILEETGLGPELLGLELTESEFMEQQADGWDTLHELRERGIRVSLDDFGTGYSSLGYLRTAPVDALKIDKRFVDSLGAQGADDAIVRAVIAMGHALGMKVVAEGVEREEQLEALRSLGCELVQGWVFSAALSADEVDKRLAEQDPEA
jgi:diguanylate cyclase (GGDEF)-like protein